MKSREQNGQFLFAGALCALLLAGITVFALRAEVPRDAAVAATLIDVAMQIAFGICCIWATRASGVLVGLSTFEDHGSPSLTSLGFIAPWLVILQIAMGAALRYKLMGAISHVAGAMLVGGFLLYFATGVMAPAPKGHPARLGSVVLLWIVLVQVVLGIAAYVVRFGQGANNGLPDTRIFTIAHILTSALALGAAWVLGELIRASSRKPEAAGLPPTGAHVSR
jgi:hypothetical protein